MALRAKCVQQIPSVMRWALSVAQVALPTALRPWDRTSSATANATGRVPHAIVAMVTMTKS